MIFKDMTGDIVYDYIKDYDETVTGAYIIEKKTVQPHEARKEIFIQNEAGITSYNYKFVERALKQEEKYGENNAD